MQAVHPLNRTTYAKCEHFWSYGGKLVLLTRNLLNAFAKNAAKSVVTRMKLFSIVSVPFSLVDLKATTEKIFKSFLLHDKEGVAMGSLSFTILAADAFDSITTFVNALLSVTANRSVKIFASMGLPVAFVISGTGTVSRTIQIAKAFNLYKKIRPEDFLEMRHKSRELFKRNLEEKLAIDEVQKLIESLSPSLLQKIEKLREKKRAMLVRLIPKEAVKPFERLFALLDSDKPFTDQEFAELLKNLSVIRAHLQKKMRVEVMGVLANLIVISALVLFCVGMATPLPYLLMVVGFLIRILSLIYQDNQL